eukprot:11186653-Lingulodinium_polyedra.AAC.1
MATGLQTARVHGPTGAGSTGPRKVRTTTLLAQVHGSRVHGSRGPGKVRTTALPGIISADTIPVY